MDMVVEDRKSIDIARSKMTEQMTKDSEFTDLSEKQVVCVAILESIAEHLDSKFLTRFIANFLKFRKSVKRRDRKELVQMMQSLKEEDQSIKSRFSELLGSAIS